MHGRAIVFRLFLLAVLAFGPWRGLVALEPPQPLALPVTPLSIETARGRFAFAVEVAATSEARARGLQQRRELPADAGMLFDFEQSQPVAMWMKDTFIPLDMLFLDESGRVRRIARNTTPHSLATIDSGEPARAVLELNGGTVARIGLRQGDRVCHPLFACSPP